MKLRLPLALILALQPLAAENFTIDGSIFPDAKTVTIQASTTDTDTTYCLHSNTPSGSFNLYYNYDVAALYTDKNSESYFMIMDPVLTAEKGAIYLCKAYFETSNDSDAACVFTTVQKTSEAYGTTYGTPQIIIEDSSFRDTHAFTLNTASATLRKIRLLSQATVNVNEGALTIAGLYSDDSQSATLTADKGIYLNNGTSYKYTGINSLSLSSAGTITIGETTTTIGETHTLSGISALTLDYSGNGGGEEVWDVDVISTVESNVTITAGSGRVQAGILKGSGSSSVTAKQLYLTTFDGGSLTVRTTGSDLIKGDLKATGDVDVESTGSKSSIELQGSAEVAGKLRVKACKDLIGADDATYQAENITFYASEGKLTMPGTMSATKMLDMYSQYGISAGNFGTVAKPMGDAEIRSVHESIEIGSFYGNTLLVDGESYEESSVTTGEIYTTGFDVFSLSLYAGKDLTVKGSVTALAENGKSDIKSIGMLTVNGKVEIVHQGTIEGGTGISIAENLLGDVTATAKTGNVHIMGSIGTSGDAAGDIALTATEGEVRFGGFYGTTLSATAGSSLTCQGALSASGTATLTASDAIKVTGAIGTDEDAAGDITLTAGSSSDVSIGSFCGNSLTITQAGAVTMGKFFSTGNKEFLAAKIASASLHVTGEIVRENGTTGIFKASTSSGSMTFDGAVRPYSLSLDSAQDITFEGVLKAGDLTNLKAKGTITVNGAAVLKSSSTVQADSISFKGDLTATGVTISGAISEATDVTLTDSTLDSLSMSGALVSGGTVTISNQTAGITTTSLTLKGGTLTLGDHNADLTTSVLNVEAETTLNANLVLSSGAKVTLAKGTTINLGCSLTLSGNTSFTLSEQVTPLHYVTLMTGVDKLYTDGDVWTTDPSNPDIVTTRLSETINSEAGTYTYTTGAKEGSLMLVYNSATGGFSVTPEPATATLSLLALAAFCARRSRAR